MSAIELMEWLLQPPPSYIIANFTRPSKRGEGGSHYGCVWSPTTAKNVVFLTYSWLRTKVLDALYINLPLRKITYRRLHTHDDSLYRMTVPPSCR